MNRYIELNSDKTPKTDYNVFYDSFENLENAGLILPEDVVVVDFDSDGELALKILNYYPTRAIKTKRGYHLYFKVPSNISIHNSIKTTTVCGCVVDYKTGCNGKKQYAIVKLNNEPRAVINPEIVDYPVLPLMLHPTKSKIHLLHLEEGNRNSEIFKHFLNVLSLDVVKNNTQYKSDELLDAIIEILLMFSDEPLDIKELNTIKNSVLQRNDTITPATNFFTEGKNGDLKINLFNVIDFIEEKLNITMYKGVLYFRTNENYYSSDKNLLFNLIRKYTNIRLTSTQDDEIYKQLKKTNNRIDKYIENMPININNNLSIVDGKIVPTEDIFTRFYIDVTYNPLAYDENVDNFLKWACNEEQELIDFLEEILGHIILTSPKPQYAFFFIANEGKNGKSTFFKMLIELFGDMASSTSLEQLESIQDVATLDGKLVNCGDDINNGIIKNSRNFKNLTSGDVVIAKQLYRDIYRFRNVATLLFSANDMPRFLDTSGGMERRLVMFPFKRVVEEDKIDLLLNNKLSTDTAKSYILNLALKGAKRIIERGNKMIIPEQCKNLSVDYVLENNTVLAFLEDFSLESGEEIITDAFFSRYKFFCENENRYPVSKTKFSRELKKVGYEVVQKFVGGKSTKYYFRK